MNELIFTENECYKRGTSMVPRGIMIHSTGANNPNLTRYVPIPGESCSSNQWNQFRPGGRQVCVHGFVGKRSNGDVEFWKTLPFNMRGWHAGGSANNSYIGIEVCEDNLKDETYFRKAFDVLAKTCASICQQYHIDPKNIICHADGYKLGIASNHADVLHWFRLYGYTMNDFRNDVLKYMQPKIHPDVQWAVDIGLFHGNENGDFMWDEPLTRKQACHVLRRFFELLK